MLLGKTLNAIGKEEASHHPLGKDYRGLTLKREGGLGISAAKPKNLALLAKLNWRLHTEREQL